MDCRRGFEGFLRVCRPRETPHAGGPTGVRRQSPAPHRGDADRGQLRRGPSFPTGREAASRVLKELGVTINPQKTRIVHVRHGFEFLGYKIKRGSRAMNLPTSKIKTSTRRGSLYAYPREKSINHFKEQIRRLTRRCAPVTTQELIQQVNPVVRGWGHHYKRAQVRKLFHRLDGWLVRRIWSHRHHKWRCCGWRTLPRSQLYGEYGLVNLVAMIPSIATQRSASS